MEKVSRSMTELPMFGIASYVDESLYDEEVYLSEPYVRSECIGSDTYCSLWYNDRVTAPWLPWKEIFMDGHGS
jgi:hypothetical protein